MPAGGRDLSEKIGGLMMLDAIDMLEADEDTLVIALISKPPPKEPSSHFLPPRRSKSPRIICSASIN